MLGTRLGPYTIDREIGSGGMGRVYAATLDRAALGLPSGATVALKVVHPQLLEGEGFFKRFLREAQIGRTVRHENVVRTLDCDAVGGAHFLVMEYVEGQTLAELLDELGTVPEELCRHVAREICKALAAIHRAGVVHRDLKPENVIVATRAARRHDDVAERPRSSGTGEEGAREGNVRSGIDHVVKVMDLGVARLVDEQMRLSQTGAFVGSVEYAAPEQFGGEVDERTDLHALGVLLYEIASGRHPFRGDSFPDVMKRVREDEPRRLGVLHPQLSPFFEEVVHTLLAKEPTDRFASADDVFEIVELGEESEWWKRRAASLRERTRRPLRRIRIPRETAVYGREAELARLLRLYELVRSGDGRVVLLEGEAGIGKSRLVDELVVRLRGDGEDPDFLFGSYPPGAFGASSGALSAAFREHLGEAGAGEYLADSPRLAAGFDAVLRGEPGPSDEGPLSREAVGTCFVRVARALAAQRPTVILVDDLHFASEDARRLFTTLALAARGHRLLVIGTYRPGVPEGWRAQLLRLDHAEQLRLARLGYKDLVAVLAETFESEHLVAQLGHHIGVKSDGNPYFAFEIIRGLREGGFFEKSADGSWVSTGAIDELEIPATIRELIAARLADLDDSERELLDVAACYGFEFDALLVAEAVGSARTPTLKHLARIERSHRLIHAAGRHFRFDHHQVQETLYASIPQLLREDYHASIAAAIEARVRDRRGREMDDATRVDVCEHLLRGGRGEAALRHLPAALDHLEAGYRNARAVELARLTLAMDGLVTGTDRVELLLRTSRTLQRQGLSSQQRDTLDEALGLAQQLGDPALLVRAQTALGRHMFMRGRLDESLELQLDALERARVLGDRELLADVTAYVSGVFVHQTRHELGRRYCEQAIALARELGDRSREALAYGNLGNVYQILGRFEDARTHHERCLSLRREIGDRHGEAQLLGNLGNVWLHLGRFAEARQRYDLALSIAREIGDRSTETIALVNLGRLYGRLGDPDRARSALEASLGLGRETGSLRVQGYAIDRLGRLAEDAGNLERAEELYREALAHRREISYARGLTSVLTGLGALLARTGRVERARELLDEAQALSREVSRFSPLVLATCHQAFLPGGSVETAERTFAEYDARLTHRTRMQSRLLLWRLTGDPGHLAESHRLLCELRQHAPPEHVQSMVELVPLHREIVEAWQAATGSQVRDDGDLPPSESPTRAG